MAGHEQNKEYGRWEVARNIGVGWTIAAALFSWELILPLVLTVGSQAAIEAKKYGGFRNALKEIFPGKKSLSHAH